MTHRQLNAIKTLGIAAFFRRDFKDRASQVKEHNESQELMCIDVLGDFTCRKSHVPLSIVLGRRLWRS